MSRAILYRSRHRGRKSSYSLAIFPTASPEECKQDSCAPPTNYFKICINNTLINIKVKLQLTEGEFWI